MRPTAGEVTLRGGRARESGGRAVKSEGKLVSAMTKPALLADGQI